MISPLQLLPLALLSVAVAKDIDIDWFIPGPQGLDSVKAEVGDTLVFEWDSVIEHNVYLAPSDSCKNLDDGKKVGDKSPVEYKIREKDAGKTLTFACEIEGHCQAGQLVSVTVDDAPSEDEDDEDDDGEEETEDEKEETEDENEDEGSCKERRDKCEENDECCSNRCNNKGRCIAPKKNQELKQGIPSGDQSFQILMKSLLPHTPPPANCIGLLLPKARNRRATPPLPPEYSAPPRFLGMHTLQVKSFLVALELPCKKPLQMYPNTSEKPAATRTTACQLYMAAAAKSKEQVGSFPFAT